MVECDPPDTSKILFLRVMPYRIGNHNLEDSPDKEKSLKQILNLKLV